MSIPQVSWTPTWGSPPASRTQNSGFLVTITAGRSFWRFLWYQINSRWLITCVCTILHRQSNQQAGHDRWINEALDNVDDKSTKVANIPAKGVLALSGSLSGTMCWPFWCQFNLRLKLRNVEPRLCEPLTYWKKNFKRVNAANIEYWRAEESKNPRKFQ